MPTSERDGPPPPAGEPLLRAAGLAKRFPGVQALDGVDFEVRRGEVHALLGGNGAGKSTLIRILGGIIAPDAGTVSIEGRPLPPGSISAASAAGVRIIHQELALAPNLTAAENILLGSEPRRPFGLLARREVRERAAALLRALRFPLDPGALVARLSVGERQLVEIARALAARPRVLVLDEPTAALDEAEVKRLFAEIEKLRGNGIGVIYITHRLEEVLAIAQRVTVLRDGRSVFAGGVGGLSRAEIIRHLVGRRVEAAASAPRPERGPTLLEVRRLRNAALADVSFTIRSGEVLGIAGQMGSGRSELARALAGVDRVLAGEIILDGRRIAPRSPRDAVRAGIVLVPEDRRREGFFPRRDSLFNLTLPDIGRWQRFGITRSRVRRRLAEETRARLDIRTRLQGQEVRLLSGGNQQKVVLGKWLGSPRRVVILDDPCRGVDAGAKEEIFAIVGRLAAAGLAVIFIASEVPEVLRASDRVLVLHRGRVQAVLDRAAATEETVASLAAGGEAS